MEFESTNSGKIAIVMEVEELAKLAEALERATGIAEKDGQVIQWNILIGLAKAIRHELIEEKYRSKLHD